MQTCAIKKNLIQMFLYLNGLQCKPVQLRKILFKCFVFERFAVAIKKNLIQYGFVFGRFAVQTVAIKKNLIQYFFVFERFAVQTVNN